MRRRGRRMGRRKRRGRRIKRRGRRMRLKSKLPVTTFHRWNRRGEASTNLSQGHISV